VSDPEVAAGEHLSRTSLRDFGPSIPHEERDDDLPSYRVTLLPQEAPLPVLLRHALALIGIRHYGPGEKLAWGAVLDTDVTLSLAGLTLLHKSLQGSIFGGGNPQFDIPELLTLYQLGELNLEYGHPRVPARRYQRRLPGHARRPQHPRRHPLYRCRPLTVQGIGRLSRSGISHSALATRRRPDR